MDKFAKIGKLKTFEKIDVAKVRPTELPQDRLKESDKTAPEPKIFTKSEQYKSFTEGVEKLKSRYRPFLAELAPENSYPVFRQRLDKMDFRFETTADQADFSIPLTGQGSWEELTLPDYRGPEGRWTAYYRTVFRVEGNTAKRLFLKFNGVDYIATVYLNGRCIGRHEGFFSPFGFEVTDTIHRERDNVLLIQVENEIPTTGIDYTELDGDKIYAATGLGWDGPEDGWHHCPAGAGIWNDVWLEGRDSVCISDLFVLPVLSENKISVAVSVDSAFAVNVPVSLELTLYPRNFKAAPQYRNVDPSGKAKFGENIYRLDMTVEDYRIWQPEEPWMYLLRVDLKIDGKLFDSRDVSFGMREVYMIAEGEERGEYVLNGEKLRLRGANEMGHISRHAMYKNEEGIFTDLMIAKYANLNFMRFTQRPMDALTYDVCDRVGMLNQCDFPLFGAPRDCLYCEGLRQVEEMERLIRNHPSVIAISYCNERSPLNGSPVEHRKMPKEDLENWFAAADLLVEKCHPGRIVKHVEGDYEPPTGQGIPDFHCYNMWYTNHMVTLGKLYQGYLPPVASDWKVQCGEYGTEGLDNLAVMESRYPAEWMEKDEEGHWYPDRIVKAQTNSMHGDWYEEQDMVEDWIRESQKHQAFATRIMTDAFRRRGDILTGTAVHLLIDAWPAGWSKALVGVDRVPKPAYYELKRSYEPLRLSLRCDRWSAYEEDVLPVELWLLNDFPREAQVEAVLTLRDKEGNVFRSLEAEAEIDGSTAACVGIGEFVLPETERKRTLYIDAVLRCKGQDLYTERMAVAVYPKAERKKKDTVVSGKYDMPEGSMAALGKHASAVLEAADISFEEYSPDKSYDAFVVSNAALWEEHRETIEKNVRNGARLLLLKPEKSGGTSETIEKREGTEADETTETYGRYWAAGNEYRFVDMNGVYFAARSSEEHETACFDAEELSYWYNKRENMLGHIAQSYVEGKNLTPLVFTYEKPKFDGFVRGKKKRLPIIGRTVVGQGILYAASLPFEDFCGSVPQADLLLGSLFGEGGL